MNRPDLKPRYWLILPSSILILIGIILVVLCAIVGDGSRTYINYNFANQSQLVDAAKIKPTGTFHTTDLVVDNTAIVGGTFDVVGLQGTIDQARFGANGIQINTFTGVLATPKIRSYNGDPNTFVTADKGSLCMDTLTPAFWLNTNGATAWSIVGAGGSISGTPTHIPEFTGPSTIGDSPITDNGIAIVVPASRIIQAATLISAGQELFSTGIIGAGGSAGSPSLVIHPVLLGADTIYAGFSTGANSAELYSDAFNIFGIGGTAGAFGTDPTVLAMSWNVSTGATNAHGHQINNVADPTAAQDALTLASGNSRYAPNPTGVTITTNYTILSTDDYLFVNTSGGALTLTLPNPASFAFSKTFHLIDKKGTFDTNNATLAPFGGEKIEGLAASKVFQTAWGGWTIVTDQTDWYTF